MTTTLYLRGREAATDVQGATSGRRPPSEGFVPGRPLRQRRMTALTAFAVAIVAVTSVLALAGRHADNISPADSLDVPAGYRAIDRADAGLVLVMPAAWVDSSPTND